MKWCVMMLCAGALAICPATIAQDRQSAHDKAVFSIRKLGGKVVVDPDRSGSPVAVVLTGARSPGDCLPLLKELNNLRTCDL